MAFSGKRKAGGGQRRRKRMMRRKLMRPSRVPRSIGSSVINVQRTGFIGSWTFSSATTSGFWKYYTFNMLSANNFGEFKNIFDEYKVNALKFTFRPNYDTVTGTDTSLAPARATHYFHTIVDPASTLIPSGTYGSGTLNPLLENGKVRTKNGLRPFSVYFKPKCQDQLSGGGTTTRVLKSPWVKTNEDAVDYRGFHIYWQTNAFDTSVAAPKVDVYVTCYMQFKNIR